ncbi:malto-oligosyltrehalose synthase [Aquicoccus sp. SCR17]|nr:malto-oligosyltrehalose synthase [Carideicomes alvinocaridis]
MKLPTATYRLQFRNGMDFDRAAALAPYLSGLGVSHLYASPLFTATQGSTHGYDVTDPTQIDPALGGREGLERLSAALKAEGLGLILDIVPNHMAFAPETPWLRDLLRHGAASRYARHFDVDPGQGRIRLPWLVAPFHRLAAERAFTVEDDPDGPVIVTGGLRIPLAETPTLAAARTDPEAIPRLHDEQPWQAVHWRTEMDRISHRRFFNITGLIGVRVEDPEVFEDVHRLLFDLTDAGIVDGIRIDHVDGLADPAGYLARLRQRVPDLPIWIEKILTGPERLPDWPVEGTTGYEIGRALTRVLTDEDGLARLTGCYREVTGRRAPFDRVLAQAKRQILTQDLSAELWSLQEMFQVLLAQGPETRELGPEAARQALLAFIEAFPRYRTYMTADDVPPEEAQLVRDTVARADPGLLAGEALQALGDLLTAEGDAPAQFRIRLQQVTGAVTAKAQEDTAFYRELRLLAMNEVGGEPDDGALPVAEFHALMSERAERAPYALTLTSSHDTKRSEDARARLVAATRAPSSFEDWHANCAALAPEGLDPNLVWYLAQSRLALGRDAPEAADRLADHAVKALREAKTQSFHTAPDEALEAEAQRFARQLAALDPAIPALDPLEQAARDVVLAHTALKLVIPGIPDIYQGAETVLLALTDPDNRRAVDFPRLERALADPSCLPEGLFREKFRLTRTLLALRRRLPDLFLHGSYEPAEAPASIFAFTRRHAGQSLHCRVIPADKAPPAPELQAGSERIWPEQGPPNGPVLIELAKE